MTKERQPKEPLPTPDDIEQKDDSANRIYVKNEEGTVETPKRNDEKPKPRKRAKLNKACVYCRRSHMICDEGRPCQRCLKRNIGHMCHDEPTARTRKKEPTYTPMSTTPSVEQNASPPTGAVVVGSNFSTTPLASQTQIPDLYKEANIERPINDTSQRMLNPASAAINQRPFFYSEHAGSEFNSLTEFLSMIDDNDVINSINMHNDPMLNKLEASSAALVYSANNSATNLQSQQQFDSNFFTSLGAKSPVAIQQQQSQTSLMNGFNRSGPIPEQGAQKVDYRYQQPTATTTATPPSAQPTTTVTAAPMVPNANSSTPYVSEAARDKFFLTAADPTTEISPEERLKQVINAKLEAGLLKPYNYAKGYQRLQNYMDNHMAVSSRQRILKPLSTFRPGFRAIAKTLKDIDLILVEESFERMLLDYDRVFTAMAIPACLWRRTGEIYRGNKEFASLVEVSIDDLKNGKLTIYELMTEESSVNFWEKYGAIAFDKTQKAVLTSCNLRTKDGLRKKNCCFSFTIRRDRYNIPSCIVGNFIPIQ